MVSISTLDLMVWSMSENVSPFSGFTAIESGSGFLGFAVGRALARVRSSFLFSGWAPFVYEENVATVLFFCALRFFFTTVFQASVPGVVTFSALVVSRAGSAICWSLVFLCCSSSMILSSF